MKKIKICHVITKLELGGAQQNTIYTAENLDKEKYQVFLVTGIGGRLDNIVEKKSFKTYFVKYLVRELNPIYDLLSLVEIYKIIKKEKPDIVHTHSSKAGILGRWAAYFAKVRIIIHTFHGFGFNDWQNIITKYIFIFSEKLTSIITDYFITVSNENIKTANRYKLITKDNFELIYSGVEKDKLLSAKGTLKTELGIKNDKILVGMISCLKPQKSPLDFIEIANNIIQKKKDIYFFIAGDGELKQALSEKIMDYDLGNSFFLLGDRLDIEKVISSADILVLTSLWEGLPRVVLESKAVGIPMVASAVDGTKEAIMDNVDGYLFLPGDIEKFTQKILELIENPDLRRKIAQNAKNSFKPDYDIKNMVIKIDSLYMRLLLSN